MRTKIYATFIAVFIYGGFIKNYAQTNKSLSNLTAPTAVNQSLLPNTDNSKDLGSSTLAWQSLFLSSRLYLQGSIAMHARGTGNFFTGLSAGNITMKGTYNTGLGSNALYKLEAGSYNTAAGYNALYTNSSGNRNSAFGYYALKNNTAGSDNTANGYLALDYNTSGSYNTATGSWALRSNTTGTNNSAYGYSALWQNSTGNDNTAVGKYAMYYNSSGYSNVAIGSHALYRNTTGFRLVAIGDSALYNFNTTDYYGGSNTAVGSKTLYANQSGTGNTALGSSALKDNKTGSYNTANGRGALISNNDGSYNTAFGYNAMLWGYSGSYNTSVGAYAGGQTMFHDVTNSTSIGYYADAYQSNQVRIGNTNVTSIGGQVGWTTFSDGRYKKDIKENIPGLAFINKLRPVSYKVDTKGLHEYLHKGTANKTAEESNEKEKADFDKAAEEAASIVQDGFVAQEVEEAANKLGFQFNGVDKPKNKDGLYGLRYDNFVVPLVKAVQELSKENDKKDSVIESLTERIIKLERLAGTSATAQLTTDSKQAITLSSASLVQNTPNPFSNTTSIRYTLPQQFTNAQIVIADRSGKTIKQLNISGSGKGVVQADASLLSSGAYSYTMLIEGKAVDTKQMLLVR